MRSIVLFLSVIATLSSCCTKKKCAGFSQVDVQFYGFDKTELDTIYTTGYEIGTNFAQETRAQQADTMYLKHDSAGVYVLAAKGGEGLPDNFEWKVFIPATNKTYLIGGYSYNSTSCNNCPFDKDDQVKFLTSYTVNGVKQPAGVVRIYK